MKDWFVQNFDAAAITGIIVAVTGLISVVASTIVSIKTACNNRKFLDDAKKRGTWMRCKSCGRVHSLSEIEWHLADGAKDNDLDGRAD